MPNARDVVKKQYESWVYPRPIPDLAADAAGGGFDLSDPAMFRRKLWPRSVEPAALKILIAGCGSNQAARYAFTNPDAQVVGIDLSQSSLDHERHLKKKHRLENLELVQLPVEDVGDLGRSFDLVVSTGVLHHLPDPDRGLRSLGAVLEPHGVMSVMLYGQHGRHGVYVLQDALRLLGAGQDREGLEVVRKLLATAPEWHPVSRYVQTAPDLSYDAGLVDTFLHRVDRAYTVPQVLEFASDNGLKFQGWLDNVHYSVGARIPAEDDDLRRRAERLPPAQQWELCELLWQAPGTHRFLLCHADRPEADYVIDFSGDAWLGYVPSLRPPIRVVVRQEFRSASVDDAPTSAALAIERNTHSVELTRFDAAALELVDGARAIGDIIAGTTELAAVSGWDPTAHRDAARRFFRRMAEWDHFLFELR